jgi:hypothetical protein
MPTMTAQNSANSALAIRKAIYSHEPLNASDMDILFAGIRQAGKSPGPEWTSLFSEALTDYVVHLNDPPDYISTEKAQWLMQQLTKLGGISTKAEFAMFIDVMNRALGVPPALSAFGLREIATAIRKGRRTSYTDEDHPAGVVTKCDADALRAVLYACTNGDTSHVSREEAEALFEIAHAANGHTDPSFDELFARAIGNYLMAVALHTPSEAEELHREKWLDERESLTGFFSRMFSKSNMKSFDMLKSPLELADEDMGKLVAADEAARGQSETITDEEAAWVTAHLTREGELTSAETRLLTWLAAETHALPAPLKALVENTKATAAGEVPSTAHFGKRHAP